MRGVTGQEDPPDPPPVGDAHVVAVDHGAQDFHMVLGDALFVQDLPHGLVA